MALVVGRGRSICWFLLGASFVLQWAEWQLTVLRASGVVDTPENLWNYYIGRVRKNLHMSLCFSPARRSVATSKYHFGLSSCRSLLPQDRRP
eukprot:2882504-Amphidinium_carterae.1